MSYMSFFARIAIQDASMVINFIQSAGQNINPSSNDFLGEIIDKWMDKVNLKLYIIKFYVFLKN